MIIIGIDFHPEFPQIASVDSDTGEFAGKAASASRRGGEVLPWSGGCSPDACARSTLYIQHSGRCGLERKPAVTHAGSSDCWPSCSLSYGLETRRRSEPSEYANRRRIARTRN
jgi:hypothetical protein